jgi:hypothetical protein
MCIKCKIFYHIIVFSMLNAEWFDPIQFWGSEDIGRIFWKEKKIGYIKNLKNILLDTTTVNDLSSWLIDQLSYFIKNPDKWSDFEEKIQNIPADRGNETLIKNLFLMWYGINAKILPENEKIVSFVAYQEDTNNNILKIFKLHTDKEYRWWKITYDLVQWLLEKTDKDIQVGKWPLETNKPNWASKKMIELYKLNWYSVDEERFIIHNNKI